MNEQSFSGLIFALNLDRTGGAQHLPNNQVKRELNRKSTTWVHLDYSADGISEWLSQVAELDATTVGALTAEEPRPRCTPHKNGLIIVLRGVNPNPSHDRENMVSIRIWMEKNTIISMRQRRLQSPALVKDILDQGIGPKNEGELLVALSDRISCYISEVVTDLDDKMDALEESVMNLNDRNLRKKLSELRREAIMVRRYLSPQRDAMAILSTLRVNWLSEDFQIYMREVADRTIRLIEDLDAIRDRGMVTHEELTNKIAEKMNRIMYFLALVTGIFLPLGLLTGLLGINVGGMPGADNPAAFWTVCGMLVGLTGFQLLLYKKMKWI
jgi:zinc transporter